MQFYVREIVVSWGLIDLEANNSRGKSRENMCVDKNVWNIYIYDLFQLRSELLNDSRSEN